MASAFICAMVLFSVFDPDPSEQLGKVWSGRDVLSPTQDLVGSEPDLPRVGLYGLQTSAKEHLKICGFALKRASDTIGQAGK